MTARATAERRRSTHPRYIPSPLPGHKTCTRCGCPVDGGHLAEHDRDHEQRTDHIHEGAS